MTSRVEPQLVMRSDDEEVCVYEVVVLDEQHDRLEHLRVGLAETRTSLVRLQGQILTRQMPRTWQLTCPAREVWPSTRRPGSRELRLGHVVRQADGCSTARGCDGARAPSRRFVRDWTSRELHTPVVVCHRRYRLTSIGLRLGVLLVELRLRLLEPLVSLIRQPNTLPTPRRSNSGDAAYREVDTALGHLSAALGLQHAA